MLCIKREIVGSLTDSCIILRKILVFQSLYPHLMLLERVS